MGEPRGNGEYKVRLSVTDARGMEARMDKELAFQVIPEPPKTEKRVPSWVLIITTLLAALGIHAGWAKYKMKIYLKDCERRGVKPRVFEVPVGE